MEIRYVLVSMEERRGGKKNRKVWRIPSHVSFKTATHISDEEGEGKASLGGEKWLEKWESLSSFQDTNPIPSDS